MWLSEALPTSGTTASSAASAKPSNLDRKQERDRKLAPFVRIVVCFVESVGSGNLVEDVCDSLVGLFACKGDDNCNDKTADEAGDNLVETG